VNGSCLAEELVFGILLVVLQSPTFEGVKIWLKTPLKPRGRYCKQGRAVPPSRHDDTYLQLLNPNREDHGASRLDGFVVQISRSDKARVEESQHLDLTRPSLLQQEERTTPWLWDSVLLYCTLTITTTNINAYYFKYHIGTSSPTLACKGTMVFSWAVSRRQTHICTWLSFTTQPSICGGYELTTSGWKD